MEDFIRIAETSRAERRSIADALDVVRCYPDFEKHVKEAAWTRAVARVRIIPLRLPSGEMTALIDVLFPELCASVSLPPASVYAAIEFENARKRQRHSIFELENAEVLLDRTVRLQDGTHLRDVITRPTYLPYVPSDLDYRILRHLIAMTESGALCSRGLREGIPKPYRKMVPKLRLLDFSAVKKIKRPPLKEIASYLRRNDPPLKNVSHQKISDALATFGICGTINRVAR